MSDQKAVMEGRLNVGARWYHGWNIVAVAVLFQATVLGLILYSFSFWIAPFRAEFGASAGTILLASSLWHIAVSFYSPFAGRLLDAYSIRLLTTGGMVVFGVGYFLISFATALWQIITIYVTLLPIGSIFAGTLAAQVATARWFDKRRGTALGITAAGTSLGGFVFPPIVTALISSMGWRSSHMILAVVATIIMVPIIWLVMRERRDDDIEAGETLEVRDNLTATAELPEWTTPQLLKSKTLWAIGLSIASFMLVFMSVHLNVALIAEEAKISPQRASLLMSTIAISMISGKLLFGAMSDKVEHRILLWITAALLLVCLMLLQVSSSYMILMLSFALFGFSWGSLWPLIGAAIASRFGANNFGRVMGLVTPIFAIAALGPAGVGYLRSSFDSYNPIFQILMALTIPAIIAAYFLGPTVRISPPTDNGRVSLLTR